MRWFWLTVLFAHAAMAQEASVGVTSSVACIQIALDRQGFGVGFIDDRDGSRTQGALKDFREARGLSARAARQALASTNLQPFATHAISQQDIDQVGRAPKDWLEASQVPRMACETLEDVLSEKYRVSPAYLRRLNPEVAAWDSNMVGRAVTVPNMGRPLKLGTAGRIEIDCSRFRLRAFDTNDHLIASFPCSVATDLARVPTGELKVVLFAPNPDYTFDPAIFPESPRAREIGRRLIIPKGPRNPVGEYWLGLSAPGFGIHGTNHPETIGRRESHGCFRLTNWDIATLARMVTAGTPVKAVGLAEGGARQDIQD